ncbi:MAG: (Fe-S)-binding protein [Bacteroidota bacterium]
MIKFNLFVLPFSLGLIYIVTSIIMHYYRWIKALPAVDKVKLSAGIRTPSKVLASLKEIFLEGLIHRRLWKRNPLLGYMHMSFAFGWFLLIVIGNLESRVYHGAYINAPYYPIFLKFFIHDRLVLFFEIFTVPAFFRFIMDFLLLFVLSGLALAWIKRKQSKWFGMKQTTRHNFFDRVALTCLWLIFPMRLLAESYTAGYFHGGGGFLTKNLGNLLVMITPGPAELIAYFFWWTYSLVLGLFFIMMPYSRYMHIPSELLLILFRHCGIQPKKWGSSFSDLEVRSCSRCGVCIDACQLNFAAGISTIQAVYLIRSQREQFIPDHIAQTCMLCGRCQEACPVGIKIDSLRLIKRREIGSGQVADFSYLTNTHPDYADVVYFAGCMSHLTPSIPNAMEGILKEAGINYLFLDRDGSICCGRPLMLAGKDKQANELIEFNKTLISQTRAKLLVTSCPICYKVFREEYNLPIRIQHHSQYLLELVKEGKIALQSQHKRVVYHDPCDLGRGGNIYEAPRELLGKISDLEASGKDRADALCCGGSLALMSTSMLTKDKVTLDALQSLLAVDPDILVTACPLCKKTFSKLSKTEVRDIAELVHDAIPGRKIRIAATVKDPEAVIS